MKRKRVSKKLKSSWRKHIDDTDVDEFLEDKRLVERLGKPFELRDDTELFKIDTRPARLSREARAPGESPLKCFQALVNTSAVSDPLVKRNKVRTKEERQHPILKKKNELRLRKGILKKKEVMQLQKLLHKRVGCFEQKQRRRISVNTDVWTHDADDKSKLSKLQNWFDDNTYLHNVRNTSDLKSNSKYRPEKVPTVISSFEPPHPGISYNPAFKDHLDLANEVAQKEIERQKEEQHLDRVTNKLFKPITADRNETNWIVEMSEGLPFHNEPEEPKDEEMDDDSEYKAINPPVVRDKKKTIQQRKKQLRLKQEEQKRKEIKEQKKKSLDICRIKHLMKEVEKEEMKKDKRSLKRLQKSVQKFEVPRRVGKNKFTDKEAVISEVTELTGSLREVLPQGNILRDELLSLQKRNIIEVSKPQFRNKKRKMKKYRLSSHRTEPLEFSASQLLKDLNRSRRK